MNDLPQSQARRAALNGNRTHRNAGLTQRVRELLDRRPCTKEELSRELDAPQKAVESALRNLLTVTGGAVSVREGRRVVYHSTRKLREEQLERERPREERGPYAVAGPIRIGRGYNWLAGML